jgi:succinoglycan biosynthesis protein ExoA
MQTNHLPDHPLVTIIVPIHNEAAHIEACLDSLLAQDYPEDRLEILIVDGMSNDGTQAKVERFVNSGRRIRLIKNPDRIMAAGLNRGIDVAAGEVVGVISGHSMVERDYVRKSVENLRRTGAWSTGGAIQRHTDTLTQQAIASATSSVIGVGDAMHNYATTAGWVESVFPGMWPRRVFDSVGHFDTRMHFNEDNELSLRIRMAGGRIWYDPDVRVRYVPRASFAGLFTQYRRYARGRVHVFAKHRAGISWRHLLPPMLVAWAAVGWLVGLVWSPLIAVWAGLLSLYLLLVLGSSIVAARGANPLLVAGALLTMHTAYGIGMFQGLADLVTRSDPR